MTPLQVSDELAREISHEAEARGLPIEEFLKSVIRRERTLADRRKIEQEQAWWFSLPLDERAQYEWKCVAIHGQSLVDYDEDEATLYRRVRAKYGKTAVLVVPANGPREIYIRSPRLVRE